MHFSGGGGVKNMMATNKIGRVPRKSRMYLDKLIGSRQMSEDGLEWLVSVTDPFHDSEIQCPGYPDMSTDRSITSIIPSTVSISKPSTLASGEKWDCHIPFIPASKNFHLSGGFQAITPYLMASNGIRNDSAEDHPGLGGGYNIITCKSGLDWQTVTAAQVDRNESISFPAAPCSGHFRLVGVGIEVHNTTPDLYRGGTVTVYKVPSTPTHIPLSVQQVIVLPEPTKKEKRKSSSSSSSSEEKELPDVTITTVTTRDLPVLGLPPSSQEVAMRYPSSRTWAAEDGVYMVGTQVNSENPMLHMANSDVAVMDPYTSTAAAAGDTKVVWTSWNGSASVPGSTTMCKALPFDTHGLIVSGLHENATLQATVRYIIERIPTTAEPEILALARAAPAYDALAIEIYSKCLAELPVGVPVGENPLGEWFTAIVDTIANVGPKIGKMFHNVGTAMGYEEKGSRIGSAVRNVDPTPQRKMTNQQKKMTKPLNNMQSGRKNLKKQYTKAERRAYHAKMMAAKKKS